MLLLLPTASSPALVLPLHRHAHTASTPSYRCPAPELKDGRNRAALKRALRSLLPGKAAQPTPSSVDTVAVPTPSEIDAEALEPSSASDEPRPSQPSAAASSAFAESPEELAGLVALTELLAPDLPDAGSASWYPEVHGEVRLLRFLRKAKGDVVGAAGRYREMLAWRREEDVDAVRERLVAMRMGPADIPSYGPMQRMMPVTIWAPEELPGVPNEERHGLQVFHLGRWDSRGLVAAKARGELSQAQFMQHWVYANEYVSLQLEDLSQERGRVAALQLVCDFRGTRLTQVSRSFFAMVRPWAAMSQDNYPSTSADIVFLNAPGWFAAVWGLISPLIGEQTRSKIRFAAAGASAGEAEAPPEGVTLG